MPLMASESVHYKIFAILKQLNFKWTYEKENDDKN